MIYYAIGDIHGHLELLTPLLAQIERDAASREGDKTIVYLGDLVDRGPDAAQILQVEGVANLVVGVTLADNKFRYRVHSIALGFLYSNSAD